jgi:hypothetical protein
MSKWFVWLPQIGSKSASFFFYYLIKPNIRMLLMITLKSFQAVQFWLLGFQENSFDHTSLNVVI